MHASQCFDREIATADCDPQRRGRWLKTVSRHPEPPVQTSAANSLGQGTSVFAVGENFMFLFILGCFEAVVMLFLQNPLGLCLADNNIAGLAWVLALI